MASALTPLFPPTDGQSFRSTSSNIVTVPGEPQDREWVTLTPVLQTRDLRLVALRDTCTVKSRFSRSHPLPEIKKPILLRGTRVPLSDFHVKLLLIYGPIRKLTIHAQSYPPLLAL